MSAVKISAFFVLAWCAMATLAQADPSRGFSAWTVWTTGVTAGNAGSLQTPTPPPTATPTPAPAPIATPTPPPTATPDVYLNFGTSPYAEQSVLTVGAAQPWYSSPSYTKFFNGAVPSTAEQQTFINDVKQDVQTTLQESGLNQNNAVSITTDPAVGASARHMMSIVSNVSYGPNPNAIGITDVGANGFSFIDKLSYASSLTDLEWAVAHNLTHEIMHAFGVGYHPDQTGKYLDAAMATWSLLINPSTTLSPAAVQAMLAMNLGRNSTSTGGVVGGEQIDGDQEILFAPVPEPSTIALWGLAGTALLLHQRRRAKVRRAA